MLDGVGVGAEPPGDIGRPAADLLGVRPQGGVALADDLQQHVGRGPLRQGGPARALVGVHPLVGQRSASVGSSASAGMRTLPADAVMTKPSPWLVNAACARPIASVLDAASVMTQNSSPPIR